MIGTRASHLWFQQAPIVDDLLFQRSTLWTQGAAIDWMIGISLDVYDLRDGVFRSVSERVNDHAAAYRAIRTDAARLRGTLNFQALRLCIDRRKTESKYTDTCASDQCGLDEGSSGEIHRTTSEVCSSSS